MTTRSNLRSLFAAAALASFVPVAHGAAPGRTVAVPAVAKAPGAAGAQWESTVWVTNAGRSRTSVTLEYRPRGGARVVAPARTVAVGETLTLDDVVGSVFGLEGAGALLVRADEPVLVTSRTFHRPASRAASDSRGAAISGVPSGSWLRAGDVATLQGAPSDLDAYRYNVGLAEVAGGHVSVRLSLLDSSGGSISRVSRTIAPGDVLQWSLTELFPGAGDRPASVVAIDVVGGDGALVVYGTQIANLSQDATAFETNGPEGQQFSDRRELEESAIERVIPLINAAAEEGYGLAASLPNAPGVAARYLEDRQVWSVSGDWASGAHVELEIDFHAGLNKQRVYDPATTTSIGLRGTVARDGALVRLLDVRLMDLDSSQPTRTMSGQIEFRARGVENVSPFPSLVGGVKFTRSKWEAVDGFVTLRMEFVDATVRFAERLILTQGHGTTQP